MKLLFNHNFYIRDIFNVISPLPKYNKNTNLYKYGYEIAILGRIKLIEYLRSLKHIDKYLFDRGMVTGCISTGMFESMNVLWLWGHREYVLYGSLENGNIEMVDKTLNYHLATSYKDINYIVANSLLPSCFKTKNLPLYNFIASIDRKPCNHEIADLVAHCVQNSMWFALKYMLYRYRFIRKEFYRDKMFENITDSYKLQRACKILKITPKFQHALKCNCDFYFIKDVYEKDTESDIDKHINILRHCLYYNRKDVAKLVNERIGNLL